MLDSTIGQAVKVIASLQQSPPSVGSSSPVQDNNLFHLQIIDPSLVVTLYSLIVVIKCFSHDIQGIFYIPVRFFLNRVLLLGVLNGSIT